MIGTGLDADRERDDEHLLRTQHLGRIDLPGVEYLATQRHHRLKLAVARLLGRTARRIAFHQNNSVRDKSCALQSASLPGSAGPAVTILRTTCLPARSRASAVTYAHLTLPT